LDLVAAVARRAVVEDPGRTPTAGGVSMPVFNRVRGVVDGERGVGADSAERIPTAERIRQRFNEGARVPLSWAQIVDGALREDRSRTMWLAAAQREPAAAWMGDRHVVFALRRVARALGQDWLAPRDYGRTRDTMVREDAKTMGEEGVLAGLLPTLQQVEGRWGFKGALKLAGLRQRPLRLADHYTQAPGLALVDATALYAALNQRWPSGPVLAAWASHCGFALQDVKGQRLGDVREAAAALLRQHGHDPPRAAPKGLGQGKRLSYLYPTPGVPGAPAANRTAASLKPDRYRELCVLCLRIWLSELTPRDGRTQRDYGAWVSGSGWVAHSRFRQVGGFAKLKKQAERANARARQAHGVAVPEQARARAAQLNQRRQRRKRDSPPAAGRLPAQFAFAAALEAVLRGPHCKGQPPKQG
jgi:hypothetical protein